MKRTNRALLLLAMAISTFLNAQSFSEVYLPSGPYLLDGLYSVKSDFADVDGDQDQDLLITGGGLHEPFLKLFLNDGIGNFESDTDFSFEAIYGRDIIFSDIDGDDDPDVLLIGSHHEGMISVKVYVNNGGGHFEEVVSPNFGDEDYARIYTADINGDNYQDVVLTFGCYQEVENPIRIFLNDGANHFIPSAASFTLQLITDIALADIDGDQDQDIVASGLDTNYEPITSIYVNDGIGNFTTDSLKNLPGILGRVVVLGDVDNDQDQDLFIAGEKFGLCFLKHYRNDEAGNFVEVDDFDLQSFCHTTFSLDDVDNDGDQDVLASGIVWMDGSIQQWIEIKFNDGNGVFLDTPNNSFPRVDPFTLKAADFDGDQDKDLLITGWNVFGVTDSGFFTNDGLGNFTERASTLFQGLERGAMETLDLDGDGDQDLIISGADEMQRPTTKGYLNEGNGVFSHLPQLPFPNVTNGFIQAIDVDNDQDQDIIIGGKNQLEAYCTKLYINEGNYIFVEDTQNSFEQITGGSTVADVDNDGDQDLILSGYNGSSHITKLYLSDGNGVFSEVSDYAIGATNKGTIAFADVDQDDDQDFVLSGFFGQDVPSTRLYKNDGNGQFEAISNAFPIDSRAKDIVFADMNGDGHQDVFLSILDNSSGSLGTNKLFLNDGTGIFTEDANLDLSTILSSSITVGDVDGDQDQDFILTGRTRFNRTRIALFTNNGYGDFSSYDLPDVRGVLNGSIKLVDMDGDQDQDLLLMGKSGAHLITKLYANNGLNQRFELSTTSFCASDGITTLSGVSPGGGIFSGPGVTDNGDGETFSIDISALGPGNHSILYSLNEVESSTTLTIFPTPNVLFINPGPFSKDAGFQVLSGGFPEGGHYSGEGVVENVDQTYSFDTSIETGAYTLTYTFTDSNGCTGSASTLVALKDNSDVEDGEEWMPDLTNELTDNGAPVFRLMGTPVPNFSTTVYPNPTDGVLFWEGIRPERVVVLNGLGQVVVSRLGQVDGGQSSVDSGQWSVDSGQWSVRGGQVNFIDLSHLAAGVYFLRLETKDGVYSARVVKE